MLLMVSDDSTSRVIAFLVSLDEYLDSACGGNHMENKKFNNVCDTEVESRNVCYSKIASKNVSGYIGGTQSMLLEN